MDADLETLLPLAEVDDRLRTLADILRRTQGKLDALDKAVVEATARHEAAVSTLARLRAKDLELQREVHRLEGLRTSAQNALAHGHGDPAAAERQIAKSGAMIDEHETELLELMEQRDAANSERVESEQVLAQTEQTRETARPALATALQDADAERATLETRRSGLLTLLARDVRTLYTSLHKTRGSALSRLDGDTCGACRHVVPFMLRNDVRDGRLVICDGCGRWLYTTPAAVTP